MKKVVFNSAVLILLSFGLVTNSLAQSLANCEALLNFSMSEVNLEIISSTWEENKTVQANPFGVPQAMPAHCHVEGAIDRRIGTQGKEYLIGFALNLPQNWNGRFLFQGGGGLNGSVGEPMGTQATGDTSALDKGFAVVSTDSGHQGSTFDGSFKEDQEALLNFYFLGNARVTPVAKKLTTDYYQSDIDKSYFVGCSTGGREGMIMSQRYPYYFDGIVSGAPAMRTGLSNLGIRWVAIELNKAADKDAEGLPIQGGTFNAEEQAFIVSSVINSCDALDGLIDGLIMNPLACEIDTKEMMCGNSDDANCLSEDKATALQSAFTGPVDSRGLSVYADYFFDTGIDDAGFIAGLINGNNNPPEGTPVNTVLEQDVDGEYLKAMATDKSLGDSTSLKMNSFSEKGGKILYYHGVSDPWFSAKDTLNYYQNMAAANGGLEAVDQWSKLYLIPGMGHCSGGDATLDNFDMLTELVNWVENDQVPQEVLATGVSMPEISRPLCAVPTHAQYSGNGDVKNAENFECSE